MTPTMATTGRATADLHGESVASRGLSGKIRGMAPVCANGFCDRSWMRSADIFIENEWCVFVASDDDDIRTRAQLHPDVLPGSGVIVPIAHRTSPFDLSRVSTRTCTFFLASMTSQWL